LIAPSAISLSHVHKSFGTVTALAGVDLDIAAGQIFGLIGPNGAGKTTLIRTLVGALWPDSGEVSVLGLDPYRDRHRLRPRLGYMPQEPALYEDLSAFANVRFFAAAHVADAGEKAGAALRFVDLFERADDPVHTLSGGMKQRVSLACALAHEPDLLFLDEPTAGIDPKQREVFWDGFRDLAAAGRTMVISTHQMSEALECDVVAILRGGHVLAAEGPQALLARGRATISLWEHGKAEVCVVDNYSIELPRLLANRPHVERIEIERESLEEIVLRMIDDDITGSR
jgi:ABC-2 type transport system ATP-binding protein